MATGRSLFRAAAALGAVALAFCTGDSPGPMGPERIDAPNAAKVQSTGTIRARTTTTGVELDPNGYTVAVDTGGTKVGPQAIGDTGTVRFTNVLTGTRTVTLSGIAPNCTPNANPQTVQLSGGTTVTVTFNVTCVATTGSLAVGTTTSGADLDPDGYTATVDGNAATAKAIAVNGTVTFTGLTAGSHTVTLSGIAANCTAATNPQTATVTAGATTTTSFAITCVTTHGDLSVTTATTGADLDPDGYTVSVDGGAGQAIADNGSFTFAALSPGTHSLTLAGAASNCTVSGANPQSVTISAGSTTNASFAVSCTAIPTSGAVTVTTTTTGVELDPDGYSVTVDGNSASAQPIGTNGSVNFSGLSAGSHSFALSGLASNCSAAANPQSATVVAGTTTTLAFTLTCVTTHGDIAVATTTTGSDLDPDGYSISLDGGAPQAIGVNASTTFTNVLAGSHTLAITGLSANCTTASSTQTVTVTAGATTNASFAITCAAIVTTGSLAVSTTTTGVDLDPDGYALTIDGNTAGAQPIASNGSFTFTGVAAGSHTVTLSGLAPNCSAAANPQSVSVVAGTTTTLGFAITCVTTHGDLTVTTTTTGSDLDPDGYSVTVSSDAPLTQAVATNGSVTFSALAAGSHTVTLSGVASNCSVSSPNPQPVTITAGATTTATFTISCAAVPTSAELTVTTVTTGADLDADGYTLTVDGNAATAQPVAINGSSVFPSLLAGTHTIALSGLAANCTASTNPQTVIITAGVPATLGFTVACVTTHGDLAATTHTQGVELDPDGYTLTVDGDASTAQPVGVNATVTFAGLSAGTHTLTLGGLAANCTATNSPQTVTIVAGATTSAEVDVTCVATTGDLATTTTTTGADLDPDGYTVTLDGNASTSQPVGLNGSVTFAALAAGSHSVALSGLAPNCSAAANPQTVTVVAGTTTALGFTITCVTTHGDLTVTNTTGGVELDPDGYTVTVDGDATTARPLAVNGSVTFTGLLAGSHSVTLGGLASNCAAASNPMTVTVVAGTTTGLAFSVTCVTTKGTITFTAGTLGLELDPDGYTAILDSATSQSVSLPVATNGSASFANVSAGAHIMTIAGLAANCSLGSTSQTISVTAGATTPVTFNVFCIAQHASTYTLVGAGDIADCARVDDDSTASVLGRIVASNPGAVVYTIGDNVYDAATATELANCYGPTWGRQKSRTFATLGNHDYKIDPNPSWDYFGTRAGPRGLGYYSYNLGDYWHIIVLNDNASYGGPTRTAGSAQDQWLQADLAANTRPCIIAMWHQPMVSSDSWYSASRKIFWDRLYAAGADIVLNGHLHYYERMYPQTPTLVRDTVTGIRQFIVGTGGASTYTPDTLNVNTVTVAPSRGVLKLTLGPGTYSWEFVWAKGQTYSDSGSGTCH